MNNKIHVAILITNEDGQMTINAFAAGHDKAKVEGRAEQQRAFLAKSQIIDVLEVEEIQ